MNQNMSSVMSDVFLFRSLQVLLLSLIDQHFSEVVFRWFVYCSHRKFMLYEKETYRITRTSVLNCGQVAVTAPACPTL